MQARRVAADQNETAMDFAFSPKTNDYRERLLAFMADEVRPAEAEYARQLKTGAQPWNVPPVMRELKAKAKAAGLWNLFLPDAEYGPGLSNAEYAPLAEITGQSLIAPEIFNCNAPDTGNMEVLVKYGSPAQKAQWLAPLLDGSIRSAFCMTEPAVASSDATNMEATAVVKGDRMLLNGRKWWSTGLGHPDCKVLIFMGLTDPEAPKHARHSMVLVPMDPPGVQIERMLPVFGALDEPYGHGQISFTDVEVPLENVIAGPGRGFEIAQGRLGPGRIHHGMRAIGAAERALELMCQRLNSRVAFGKPVSAQSVWHERIADARCRIEMARLLTLKAAYMMDTVGNKVAKDLIGAIKVVAPQMAQTVADRALQAHGGMGVSDDTPIAYFFTLNRYLRIADGPDEVHMSQLGKQKIREYNAMNAR